MAMNAMSISQAATVLNAVVEQATGQSTIEIITTPEQFTAVAQTALLTGVDPIINAISQMWSRTIFSSRNYKNPMMSLEWDLPRYGNAIRKLSPIAAQMVDDMRFTWPAAYDSTKTTNPYGNGESVDHWKISKQDVIQTNFYGTAVYQQRYTTFKDSFDVAFSSPEEFSRFNAMNLTERSNDWESYREAVARGIQANLIGAVIKEAQEGRVVHLVTDYNAQTGAALTAQTVYAPDNFPTFVRWLYAKIATIIRQMGVRSNMYQTTISGKAVLRHSRPEDLRVALYAPAMDMINSMGVAETYHDDLLKLPTYEAVSYWQAIDTPDSIAIQPVYTSTSGTVTKSSTEVEQAGILGVIHDKDALGYAITNNWTATTPLNIDGGYWNTAIHANVKTIMDNTEKAVVLLLD